MDRLDDAARSAVDALVSDAGRADGVTPLSEQSRLAVHGRSGHEPGHVLAYAAAGTGSAGEPSLAGYAQVDDRDAELVVAPAWRRQGVGSLLLDALPPEARVWAHGDQPAAEAFAAARNLEVARELFVLGRRFDEHPPRGEVVLTAGLVARPFRPGQDEAEWLRVNALAFAHHPEQGRLTRADLDARMGESWFDPEGLLLVVPQDDPQRVAAFHWTKVRPEDGKGEVYVVGVDPAYQGRGLGRPLTLLGLEHLRAVGVDDVILYVDGDNPAALRVYRGLGFTTRSVDRMYAARR
ncbi:MAG: mycothiol synthase [Lapillicoccus sp.]